MNKKKCHKWSDRLKFLCFFLFYFQSSTCFVMSESSKSLQGFSPRLLPIDDDLSSNMSRGISTNNSIMGEAAHLPPAIPPFGTSPAPSFGRSFPNHPVDMAEHLFTAHGAPVPSNSVAAYENGLINLPEQQVARVVKEHLLFGSPKLSGRASPSLHSVYDSDAASNAGHSSVYDDLDAADYQAAVHQLPGGSIVDGIYKWAANVDSQHADRRKRSKSFSLPPGRDIDDSTATDLRVPGGFRRHYVISKAVEQGKAPPNYITKNFFDFLCLYGNFGGEDLNDDEGYEEDVEDDEETAGLGHQRHGDENTPLLPKQDQPAQGTATASKAVFLLLKSFVGTGKWSRPSPQRAGKVFFLTLNISIVQRCHVPTKSVS
jgi:solute carrier family 36 (proton-coupled amino acid transporter)